MDADANHSPADHTARIIDTRRGGNPAEIVDLAAAALAAGVPADLSDDRFSGDWADRVSEGPALVAVIGDHRAPAAFAGAVIVPDGGTAVEVLVSLSAADRAGLAHQAVASWLHAAGDVGPVEVWIKPEVDGLDLSDLGLVPYRRLHQMRVPLPLAVAIDTIETRPFVPGIDDEIVVETNNRAFVNHPVQGTLTLEQFRDEMAASWFRPDGLRIAEIDGRIAGFCWTKIHPASDHRPALAEIYVICVDPDFHGRGLGRPMTGAGLEWLIEQGLELGMLYVEADNIPAIRTYEGMGFEVVRSDAAWRSS